MVPQPPHLYVTKIKTPDAGKLSHSEWIATSLQIQTMPGVYVTWALWNTKWSTGLTKPIVTISKGHTNLYWSTIAHNNRRLYIINYHVKQSSH